MWAVVVYLPRCVTLQKMIGFATRKVYPIIVRLHRKTWAAYTRAPMNHPDRPQAFVEGVANALILTWVMWVGIAELAMLAM